MAARRTLTLTEEEHTALVTVRDHDPNAQMRERAAALLKIAGGMTPHAVARSGLLRPRDPDSVYRWLTLYHQERLSGIRAHLHGGSTRGRLRRGGARAGALSPRGGGSA